MTWIYILDHHYNLEYMQEIYWLDGMLRVHLLGRSVPETFADPDGSMYRRLCEVLEITPRGKGGGRA